MFAMSNLGQGDSQWTVEFEITGDDFFHDMRAHCPVRNSELKDF